MDRVDTSSASDMEVASEMMNSSSSSSHGSPRNGIVDECGCGSIHQMVSIKRRRVVGHTHDVLETDEGVVDDLVAAAAQGDGAVASATHASADAFIDRPVVCVNGNLSGIVSQPGNIGDFPPFTSSTMSTRERRRINRRRSFKIANANAATTALLSFVLICATSAAATTANEAILGDGVGAPTLDERFQRRHVTSATSSARTNLRRSSSFSTAYSEVATPEDNSVGRRMADFFTDRKAKPLEFRIENVNSLRPTQSQEESDMAAVGNTQNFLPPLSPTMEKRATIVFHQPTIDSEIRNKATHIPSKPAQTGPASPQRAQYQPHGGTHWHEAANFGPQIHFTSVDATIPGAKLSFHSTSTTPTSYSEGRENEFRQSTTYQDIEEDYQNFYKQTQEEKDETAKAREGLLEKLYGSSLERPNHSADIGENSVSNRGSTETFAAADYSANGISNPLSLQGRDNHYSFTLVGNSIAVVVPGEANPIPTEFTIDPSNNDCVVESGCTVFYSTSTNDFVDANGAAVGVAIDIDTIISQNAGSSSSGNNNRGYTLFLEGNNIVVRYQGQNYPTQFTVESNNCVVQSNNCEYYWDGNGGFVNEEGRSVSVEIDLETIITSSGAGSSTTGGGGTTTTTTETTETVVTEETTTGGNNNNRDEGDDDGDNEDEASGPTMEPIVEASDSADEDSAEHSGKGYSRSSGKGKGKGKGSSR